MDFGAKRLEERLKTKVEIPDICSALLAPLEGQTPRTQDLGLLNGDSQLIIVAGSDTSAMTLSSIIYELCRNPDDTSRLRKELAPYMTDNSGEALHGKIANLDHLNGIINETLRLHPPILTAIQQKTSPEGIDIDGSHIPGEMTVWCPQSVLGHSEALYPEAENFIPERWYKNTDLVKDKSAFTPFSIGPYGCISRPLALLNIRTTIARLVTAFNIEFAQGEDGRRFMEDAKEHFTMQMGQLDVSFTRR